MHMEETRHRESQRGKLATNRKEYRDLLGSDEDWFARTEEDVKRLRDSRTHPLSYLSLEDFHEFLDGLVYRDGGVVGLHYKPLMTLPLSQVFEAIESFGLSREVLARGKGGDDLEYRNLAPGVCEFSFWDICL